MPVRTKVVGRKNKRVVDVQAPNTTMGTKRSPKKTLKGKVADFRAKAKPAGARKKTAAPKTRRTAAKRS